MSDYFISDLHFNHDNLIKFEAKQFATTEERNEFIVNSLAYIHYTDRLYVLGDVGKNEEQYIRRIRGYKILIKGNHDKKGVDYYKNIGFDEVYNHPIFYSKNVILSHIPIPVDSHFINIHGHLHGSVLDSPNHINVNIHIRNYKCLSSKQLERITGNLPHFNNHFLQEWFADQYVFTEERDDIVMDENKKINLEETLKLEKWQKKYAKKEGKNED